MKYLKCLHNFSHPLIILTRNNKTVTTKNVQKDQIVRSLGYLQKDKENLACSIYKSPEKNNNNNLIKLDYFEESLLWC